MARLITLQVFLELMHVIGRRCRSHGRDTRLIEADDFRSFDLLGVARQADPIAQSLALTGDSPKATYEKSA
jgi:hypothetical protein